MQGIKMLNEFCGGTIASKCYDFNPHPIKQTVISVSQEKLRTYLGITLVKKDIQDILTHLGFTTTITEKTITVTIPTYRKDMTIDVDIIEEIARIYGYHNLPTHLPTTEPPIVMEDPILRWEHIIKQKLCDLGYTEFFTYSMISEELMQIFHINKSETYSITNPLSSEWVYMRPMLIPSMLEAIHQNLNIEPSQAVFELSMTYQFVQNNLPHEVPTLTVALTGKRFSSLKGLSEMLFDMFGIPYPSKVEKGEFWLDPHRSLRLDTYGSVGEIDTHILTELHIQKPITILNLSLESMLANARLTRQYIPIPKYPASFEDLAFVVQEKTPVGPMIETIQTLDPLISDVSLFDSFQNIRTFHITYQSKDKNLTAADTQPVREKIIQTLEKKFQASLKTA
jgi:phenylalanyl-tRNA synthetase beta chain